MSTRRTRSGAEFSPYVAPAAAAAAAAVAGTMQQATFDVHTADEGESLGELLKTALALEDAREADDVSDTEGLELSYTPQSCSAASTPLSSPPLSPLSSPPPSPRLGPIPTHNPPVNAPSPRCKASTSTTPLAETSAILPADAAPLRKNTSLKPSA